MDSGYQNYAKKDEIEIDVVDLLVNLLDKVVYILIAAVLCAAIAFGYTKLFVTPMYKSSAQIYILNTDETITTYSQLQLGNNLAKDYLEVFKLPSLGERVKDYLGENASILAGSSISTSNADGTRIIYVTASSPSAKAAAIIADAYAECACDFIAEKMNVERPSILETAKVPTGFSSPNLTKNILTGFAIGFIGAAFVFVLIYLLDDRIKKADDVVKTFGVPVLGLVTLKDDGPRRKYARSVNEQNNKDTKETK